MKEVTWGPEIKWNKEEMPDWVYGDLCAIKQNGLWFGLDARENAQFWSWFDAVDSFRLPADHPHYQKSETDHSEAREPLSDAAMLVAPVDHGTDGMFKGRDGQLLHEPTIRACLNAARGTNCVGLSKTKAMGAIEDEIEGMLERHDAILALIEEWEIASPCPLNEGEDAVKKFAAWLKENDRIKL